jgi:DNA-binding XRE family transcriptional regulator
MILLRSRNTTDPLCWSRALYAYARHVAARPNRKNPNQELRQIGRNIRFYREELGLTQESLAEATDTHDRTIGRIERGELNFSILHFRRICRALNRSSDHLLFEKR